MSHAAAAETPEIHPLTRGTPEWDAAWAELARDPWNAALPDPTVAHDVETGERWQYMGPGDGGHVFRHRCHPRTGARIYVTVRL
jgi:hypothetical protein